MQNKDFLQLKVREIFTVKFKAVLQIHFINKRY